MDLKNKVWIYSIIFAGLVIIAYVLQKIIMTLVTVIVGATVIYLIAKFLKEKDGLKEVKNLMRELPKRRR